MTVKDRVGRTRYVAVAVEGAPSRRALDEALRRAAEAVWGKEALAASGLALTAYDGRHALVRVKHPRARDLRSLLEGAALGVRPLGTSGTARGARERFVPDLARGKRR